jgi:hypothetical protein
VEYRSLMDLIPVPNSVQSFRDPLVNGMNRLRGRPAPVFHCARLRP